MRRIGREWHIFLLATQFLTRLPVVARYSPERMAATPGWYPAVGLLIGASVAAVYWIAAMVFPPMLAALLSTVAGLLLTGCFHEDGFADACDGLGGGATRERALEIMRDSRLGTYGAAGLGMMLAVKVVSLGAMPGGVVPAVLIAGHAASRAASVVIMATSSYVRAEGAGKPVARGVTGRRLGLALGLSGAAMAAVALVAPVWAVLGGGAGLMLGAVATRARFERRLGGYTGDCLGAVQQVSEVGFYLGVLACL